MSSRAGAQQQQQQQQSAATYASDASRWGPSTCVSPGVRMMRCSLQAGCANTRHLAAGLSSDGEPVPLVGDGDAATGTLAGDPAAAGLAGVCNTAAGCVMPSRLARPDAEPPAPSAGAGVPGGDAGTAAAARGTSGPGAGMIGRTASLGGPGSASSVLKRMVSVCVMRDLLYCDCCTADGGSGGASVLTETPSPPPTHTHPHTPTH
jgi:hypothetical protein